MKRFALFLILLCSTLSTYAQVTKNPYVRGKNNDGIIYKIELTADETIVYIKVPKQRTWGGWIQFSSATVLVPSDQWSLENARKSKLDFRYFVPPAELAGVYADALRNVKEGRQTMSDLGYLIRSLGPKKLDTKYKSNKSDTYFELHFDRLPVGVENVYIRELMDGGFEWYGIKVNNPYPTVVNTGYNETSIKPVIDSQNDGIVGIYQGVTQDDPQYKLACYKDGESYKLIYLCSRESLPQWRVGDVKAELEPTATPTMYTAKWRMGNKTLNTDCYVVFEGGSMKTFINGDQILYVKLYPTSSANVGIGGGSSIGGAEWSGTGFALKNNYIVTNYHVIEDAKTINIQGVNGDFSTKYNASVVASDKFNDLAILKVEGVNISTSGIPYSVKTSTSEVGEDAFVLGYPLTSTMGEEIKLTTGVVSSKTGFQGDVSLYQISAPIQPGNSGGPLFDGNGNVIGIVSAKHKGAENVGYAIKASYLRNLMESALSENILPQTNKIASYKLSDKVKSLKNYVYYITCSSRNNNATTSVVTNNNGGSTSSTDKVYNNPYINRNMSNSLKVLSVKIQDNQTVITFSDNNRIDDHNSYQWFTMNKDAYISANGQRYTLIKADGIAIAPEKTYFSYPGETKTFTLYFPAILKSTTSIDFIEADDSDWRLYGIQLR